MNNIVAISHYNEDLLWTNNIKCDYIIISKTINEGKNISYQEINKGNEASGYLKFLVDNYENLKNYKKCLFFHGHQNSWHQGYDADFLIENLNYEKIDFLSFCDNTYYEIYHNRVINIGITPYDTIDSRIYNMIKESWFLFEKYLGEMPSTFGLRPGAQFVVNVNEILKFDKNFYINCLDWCVDNHDNKYGIRSAHLFEWLWNYMFTENNYEKKYNVKDFIK